MPQVYRGFERRYEGAETESPRRRCRQPWRERARAGIRYAAGVNIVETILVLVLIPAAIYGAVSLATLRPKFAGTPRYRPGQDWEYPPLWWSANPEGVGGRVPAEASDVVDGSPSTARGGARGNW